MPIHNGVLDQKFFFHDTIDPEKAYWHIAGHYIQGTDQDHRCLRNCRRLFSMKSDFLNVSENVFIVMS